MLAAMLAGVAPAAANDGDADDEPDTDAAPVPTAPGTPYQPLVNRAPKGYSPPYGPPPWASNPLAMALAGGGAPSPSAGASAGASPPLPRPASPAPQDRGFLASLLGGGTPTTGSRYNPQTGEFLPEGQGAQPAPAAAVGTANQSPANQIAGQVSDIGEDSTMAGYRTEHDAAITQLNAALAKGDAAAAAGNYEAAKIYFSAAQESAKRADEVQDKAIEYAKPLKTVTAGQHVYNAVTGKYEQPVPDEDKTNAPTPEQAAQITAAGGNPNQYVFTSGKPERIPIPLEEDSLIKEYNFYKNNLPPGESPMGFNDFRMEKTAGAQKVEPLIGANGRPVDENLTGPDVLKAVPPHVAEMAQRMLNGLQPVPASSVRSSPLARQALIAAQAVDPTLDANESKVRMGTQKDFTSGPTSKVITAGNTALGHLTELSRLVPTLNNFDLQYGGTPLNAAVNAVKGTGAAGASLARFNELNQLYSAEMEKFYAGSSGGTAGERKQLELNISPNMTPTQQMAAIQTAATALASKVEALQGQWHSGMGPMAKDFDVIHPENKAFVEAMRSGPLGTLLAPGGNAPAPPAAPPTAPQGAPPPGFIKGGFRFKGGDPSQRQSWEPVR